MSRQIRRSAAHRMAFPAGWKWNGARTSFHRDLTSQWGVVGKEGSRAPAAAVRFVEGVEEDEGAEDTQLELTL